MYIKTSKYIRLSIKTLQVLEGGLYEKLNNKCIHGNNQSSYTDPETRTMV